MARNRTPTSVLESKGSFDHDPQRRADRENEPVPKGPLGDPPGHFNEVQKGIWKEIVLQIPDGVLMISDRMLMEIYCTLVARHRGGYRLEDGSIAPPGILKASEYNTIISILSRMGLTPADRSRVNAPDAKKKDAEDTFSRLATTGRGGSSDVKQ